MKIDANYFYDDIRLALTAECEAENHQLKWLKEKVIGEGGICEKVFSDDGFDTIVVMAHSTPNEVEKTEDKE